mmetsp:Transcript_2163/g.2518  ORF Transcript_2163/g.2518 Transcript_2163/m.2518 type:complete len:82 (+) Transcript_2163:199-444(+)
MTSIECKQNGPNVLGDHVLPHIHQLSIRCPTISRSIVYQLDPVKINDWIASSGASLPPYGMNRILITPHLASFFDQLLICF